MPTKKWRLFRANVELATFTVSCPVCDKPLKEPETDNYVWNGRGLDIESPPKLRCDTCYRDLRLPEWAFPE